jgi:predicted dehydrogenase
LTAENQPILMVGYNRRFAALTNDLVEKLGTGGMSMLYRINASSIPPDSWIQDPEIGGGRILGEVCHFVDYLTYVNGSLPVSVHAAAMNHPGDLNDTLTISLKYRNGSIGSILYFANGSKTLNKEYIEIYRNGLTAIIKDFREMVIYGDGKPYRKKLISQEKGQKTEVHRFVEAGRTGVSPISFEEISSASEVTFMVLESLRTGKAIQL